MGDPTRTPDECVRSLQREFDTLREQGADAASAVSMLSNKHGLAPERIEFFCLPTPLVAVA